MATIEHTAAGYIAYVMVADGHMVNGSGRTKEAALAELEANLDLDRRLSERVAQARREARPEIQIP